MTETEISIDARCLLTAWFLNGHRTIVEVGGSRAKSRLTERAKAAVNELTQAGYITAEQITPDGRMMFQGTEKRGKRLSIAEMEEYGAWSPTEPNPDASPEAKAKSTATLHISAGRAA